MIRFVLQIGVGVSEILVEINKLHHFTMTPALIAGRWCRATAAWNAPGFPKRTIFCICFHPVHPVLQVFFCFSFSSRELFGGGTLIGENILVFCASKREPDTVTDETVFLPPSTPHRRRARYSGTHPRRFDQKYKEHQ